MPIHDLGTHLSRFVTVAELAEYWAVSRRQILKRIESGALDAIRLGSRLYRVRTEAALEFERHAAVASTDASKSVWYNASGNTRTSKLPETIGLRRVPGAGQKATLKS